jgi:PAS domain S-box-containing protein
MDDGWSGLFRAAFRQSRNAMALVDEQRVIIDVNGSLVSLLGRKRASLIDRPMCEFVAHGPIASPTEWTAAMNRGQFTGEARLLCADDGTVDVQWGATTEVATGRRLVLLVVLATSRWGRRVRPGTESHGDPAPLSQRQREIVRLVARGLSGPEIADELQIANETVRTHVRSAMARLEARSRAHLVAKALGEGHI